MHLERGALHPTPPACIALLCLACGVDALSVKEFHPADGATGQCLDTPLRMVLSGKPAMAWNGAIRIRNLETGAIAKTWSLSANPGDPNAASVGASWPWQDSVGPTRRNVWPVVLDSVPEFLAEIRLPAHLLSPSTRYQVEVDAGVLKGADGSAFSGVAAGAWKFATGPRPSAKSTVVVAQDNSGDACSIQGGIDLVPSSSRTPVQVLVRPGHYREMVAARNKSNLRLYGSGQGSTFLRYLNNNNLNPSGTSERNLVLLGGDGMRIRALSIVNTTSVTGGQAEAIYLQGDSIAIADVFLHSFQDTWLNTGGRAYAQDCRIEGSVDFLWGYAPAFFKRCSLVVNRTGGVAVQPRNTTTHGFVFDSCRLSAAAGGYSGVHFARDAGTDFPRGEVRFLHTTIVDGSFLAATPWTVTAGMDTAKLGFCEYLSRDASGKAIAIADPARRKMQCSADTAARHADPAFVLSGWVPVLPPLSEVVALANPAAALRAAAAGAPALGRLIPSAEGMRLRVGSEGPSRVREILPDGRTRELFRCDGPCERELPPGKGGISWIEISSRGIRQILTAWGGR